MHRRVLITVACISISIFVAACEETVVIRNTCSEILTDIKVDDKSIGSLAPYQEARADVSKYGRTPITWKYNGLSQSDQISGTGVYEGRVYELNCTYGDWQ